MDSWSGIAVRLAVYASLALAFGIPFHALTTHRPGAGRLDRRWPLLLLVIMAFGSSVVGLLILTAAMAGTPIWPIDIDTLWMVLTGTSTGTAFVVRFVALAVALLAVCRRYRLWVICVATGVASATVAWTGHGAMDEGRAGMLHLAADIVHMLAGGAWIGAIAAMLVRFLPGGRRAHDIAASHASLSRFATTGTIMVGLIVVSGAINGWMILGPDGIAGLPATLYGKLLIAKLALFAAMLAMAAGNRWVLTPRLDRHIATGDHIEVARTLRASLITELMLGFGILAVVSFLGTLSPQG